MEKGYFNCLEKVLVYQSAVKSAKATYFSNLIIENHSRPKVLFSVINSVVNSPVNTMCTPSEALCESFLRFFINKISNLRSTISPSHPEPYPIVALCFLGCF